MASSSARDFVVRFLGDTSSLSRSTRQAENDLNSFQSGVRSKFQGFDPLGDVGKSFGTAIAGYAAVTVAAGAAFTFLKNSAQAAMEDTQEQKILAQTLRDTVQATDEQIAANEKWITSTQNATGVMDSQIRDALVPLLASTHDVATAHDLLSTAMDISTARGLDLTTVAVALSKAHDGNVGALGRLGISYKDAEGNALSFSEVVARANETFGGATAAAADTAAGKLAILSAKFKDLQEQIGEHLTPAISAWADVMSNTTIPAIGSLMSAMDALYQKAALGLSYFGDLGRAISGAFGFGGDGGPSTAGFSGGGGGGAGRPGGGTGLGGTAGVTVKTDPSFVAGLVGVTQGMAQEKYKQDALAAFYAGLAKSAGGGGGGGGGGGKSAAELKKEADDKAIAETLRIWADARIHQREIEDNMYKDGAISADKYKEILEKRLTEEEKYSDEWQSQEDKLTSMIKDAADEQTKAMQKAADDQKKIREQALRDQEDAISKMQEIQDNEYEVGAISAEQYIGILRQRLSGQEQFTNDWTRTWEKIQQVSQDAGLTAPSLASTGSVNGLPNMAAAPGVNLSPGSSGGTIQVDLPHSGDSIVGGSGAGAQTFNMQNVYVQANDPNQLVAALNTYARQNGGLRVPGGVTAVS